MTFVSTKIVTDDVPALVRFYSQITGMRPLGSDDYVEFQTGGCVLAICSRQVIELFGAGAAVAASNRSLIIGFEVGDVDRERERLGPVIGPCVQEPADQPWGGRSMLFRDPDGNLVSFSAPAAAGCGETRGASNGRKGSACGNHE